VAVFVQAPGVRVPFGWPAGLVAVGLGPCGVVILLWAAVGPWDYIFLSLVLAGLLALVAAGMQVLRHRRLGRSRDRTMDWMATGVVALAFAVLILWEKWLGLPARPVRGASLVIAGAMCVVLSLSSRQRRVYLAGAASLVPFGIALPLCSPQQVALVGGGAMVVAGVVATGILAGQLLADRRDRERAAD
jgi:hypothetical protein